MPIIREFFPNEVTLQLLAQPLGHFLACGEVRAIAPLLCLVTGPVCGTTIYLLGSSPILHSRHHRCATGVGLLCPHFPDGNTEACVGSVSGSQTWLHLRATPGLANHGREREVRLTLM